MPEQAETTAENYKRLQKASERPNTGPTSPRHTSPYIRSQKGPKKPLWPLQTQNLLPALPPPTLFLRSELEAESWSWGGGWQSGKGHWGRHLNTIQPEFPLRLRALPLENQANYHPWRSRVPLYGTSLVEARTSPLVSPQSLAFDQERPESTMPQKAASLCFCKKSLLLVSPSKKRIAKKEVVLGK